MLETFITHPAAVPSIDDRQRQLFIDHLEWLRTHRTTQKAQVDSRYSYPEQHSFYGYCKLKGYETVQIYPMMLLNGIADAMAFMPAMDTLYVPSVETLQKIISMLSNE